MSGINFVLKICLLLTLINGAYLQRPFRYNRQSNGGGIVRFEETPRCTTLSREIGVCVVLRSCESLLPLLHQGKSDYLRKSICGYDGLEPKVCCPVSTPTIDSSTTSTTTTTTTTSTTTTARPPTEKVFPDTGNYYQQHCGFSNHTHGRVVGGIPAERGAWPWLAALGYKKKSGDVNFLCGGAIISPRHILTAGHCVHRRNDLYAVRLGEHNIKSEDDGANPIDVTIAEKILHPGYNPTTYQNDIAILRLTRPVEFNFEIRPICLPESQQLREMTYTRSFPYVAGWGAVQFRGSSNGELREVQLPVVDPAKCKAAFSNFKTTVIDEKVMCAGFARGGKDACQGDSGGPLMWPLHESFYVIGVVSYGYKCAEPGYPGVYTRITYFLDWIKSVTGT